MVYNISTLISTMDIQSPVECIDDDNASCNSDDASCFMCRDMVYKDSKSMLCDLCGKWVHLVCVAGLTEDAYRTFQSLKGSILDV